jgi:hypothetical protein
VKQPLFLGYGEAFPYCLPSPHVRTSFPLLGDQPFLSPPWPHPTLSEAHKLHIWSYFIAKSHCQQTPRRRTTAIRSPGHGRCMKVAVFIYLQTSVIRWQCHVMYVVPSALPCSDFVIAISRPYDTQLVLMDTQIRSLHLSRLLFCTHLPSRENIPWLVLFGPSTKKTFSPLKPEPSCHAAWFCLSHLPRDPVPIVLESLSSFRCRIHQGNAEGLLMAERFGRHFLKITKAMGLM